MCLARTRILFSVNIRTPRHESWAYLVGSIRNRYRVIARTGTAHYHNNIFNNNIDSRRQYNRAYNFMVPCGRTHSCFFISLSQRQPRTYSACDCIPAVCSLPWSWFRHQLQRLNVIGINYDGNIIML